MPKNKHNQVTPIEATPEDNLEKDTKDHDPEKSDKPSTDAKNQVSALSLVLLRLPCFSVLLLALFC